VCWVIGPSGFVLRAPWVHVSKYRVPEHFPAVRRCRSGERAEEARRPAGVYAQEVVEGDAARLARALPCNGSDERVFAGHDSHPASGDPSKDGGRTGRWLRWFGGGDD